MKNVINIGGVILLLVLLLSKKSEKNVIPVVVPEADPKPEILIPEVVQVPPSESRRLPAVTNASLSPTLTTYQPSEIERLEYALQYHPYNQNGDSDGGGLQGVVSGHL